MLCNGISHLLNSKHGFHKEQLFEQFFEPFFGMMDSPYEAPLWVQPFL